MRNAQSMLLLAVSFSTWSTTWASCSSDICVAGCGAFDARYNSCGFDFQVYGTKETCICAGLGSVAENEQTLLNCLSCNGQYLGINSLETYQEWAAICGAYQTQGSSAGIALASGSPGQVLQYYSASVLPAVQSDCGGNPAPAPTPVSHGGSGSYPSPIYITSTSSVAGGVGSSPFVGISTSTGAAPTLMAFGHALAWPLAFGLLL